MSFILEFNHCFSTSISLRGHRGDRVAAGEKKKRVSREEFVGKSMKSGVNFEESLLFL